MGRVHVMLAAIVMIGCSADAELEQRIDRLEQEAKEAKKTRRALNEQLASCLESKLLMEANRRESAAPKAQPTTSPSTPPKPPSTKPQPRCDPRDPLCSDQL